MTKYFVTLILCFIFITNTFAANAELVFWNWFEKNENMLFHYDRNTESIFNRLSKEIKKVDSELTFEFGPISKTGKREFVISAGGIKSSFPSVESLFKTAPKLKRWKFTQFRSRRFPLNNIEFKGKKIASEDVHYNLYKDGEKLGILVFLDGYNEKEKNIYGQIGFLFLDEALGEYDVEMKLGFIEFNSRESKYFKDARPISELPIQFDKYFSKKR